MLRGKSLLIREDVNCHPIKPKVLVAEDHPAVRAKINFLLQGDCEVIASVADGTAAVEATFELKPDVVILDVVMPSLDGPDVARRLKADGCNARIIFLSVSKDMNQITACFAAGGNAYVSKMRMATDLFHAITQVLAGGEFISAEV